MVIQSNRTFVYGRFYWPGKTEKLPPPPSVALIPPLGGIRSTDEAAVEVLREFTAREFVGKLYVKGPVGNWVPADWNQLSDYPWFVWYGRLSAKMREHGKAFGFEIEGSGNWKVLFLRKESDENGPYVAMALQY